MKNKYIFGLISLVVLGAIYFGIKTFASGAAEKEVSATVEKFSEFVNIEYDDVDVTPIAQHVTISNITISPKKKLGVGQEDPVKVQELTIYDIDDKAGEERIPEYIDVEMKGIEFDIDDLGEDADDLRALGYEGMVLVDMRMDYKYDDDKKELKVKNFTIGSDEMGELKMSFHLSNIDLNPNMNPFGLMMSVMFHGGAIEYKDHSFVERAMKKEGENNNMSIAAFKEHLLKSIDEEIGREPESDFAKDAMNEMKDFIKNPKQISISANPQRPINAGNFMNSSAPEEIIELIGLKIKS